MRTQSLLIPVLVHTYISIHFSCNFKLLPQADAHLIVVTWAQVFCLICTPEA